MEGFGAANILQEILTVKSDDVMGRAKVYEAIVKGDNLPKPGIPEAMNVLLHELRGLDMASMTDDYCTELYEYLFPNSNVHINYHGYFEDLN